MMLSLRLAVRNTVRYARRTLITTGTIAFSFWMLVFVIGMGEGSYQSIVDNAARSGSGHVVLQSPGHELLDPVPLADPDAALAAVAAAAPTATAAPRAQSLVLASASSGSASLLAMGVEPGIEKNISMIPEVIVDGEWLPDEAGRVGKAVIGRSLAKRIRVEVGDKMVLTGNDADQRVLVRISGLFATGSPNADDGMIVVDRETLGALLDTPDEVHQVAIVLDDFHDAEAVAKAIQIPGVDSLTWAEAVPELGDYVKLDRQGADVMFYTLFTLVGLAILNSILMSVMERERELGVLLALGTRPGTIFSMVVLEGLILSVLSVALGLALGLATVQYMSTAGLDLAALMGGDGTGLEVEGFAFDAIIYPRMNVMRTLNGVFMVVMVTVFAALYPAWKAARVPPVDAIRRI
jgi:ABC-type lipoprotein release transport system permease subunit